MPAYHTNQNPNNQNSWSPGRPIKGCLEPNAPDERSRFDAELERRARYHENSGESESEAWQAAADDLGSLEHQRWIAGYRCSCPGCVKHIEALERINRTLAVECDRLQAQLKAAALHGRDRRAA
jgi:hypothetical protein